VSPALETDLAVGRLRISYQLDTVAGGGTLFGGSDNRGIGGSQRKALIRIHQVGNLRIAGARQVDGRKVTISQDRREQRLHAGTGFAGQESSRPQR